jgi:cytochrome P450
VLNPAGADPPAQALRSLQVALLSERERYERLGAERGIVRWALVEALRWEAPIVFVIRRAGRTVSLSGVEIPATSDVCAVVGAANRDERRYRDPDRFDLDRRADDHLSFSFGRHYCMGSHFSLLVGEVGIAALLDRFPDLRLDPAAPPPSIVGFAFRQPTRIAVRLRG